MEHWDLALMSNGNRVGDWTARATRSLGAFMRARRGNVAVIYALALLPLAVASGVGLDYARAVVVRSSMSEAIDAAALAIGSTQGLTTAQMQTLAQQYFSANYKTDSSFGTPATLIVTPGTNSVTITVTDQMPTTLLGAAGIKTVPISVSNKVVWGQMKLWVSLVLDNTGSMSETDNTGTSKITALKSASHQLLTMLQNASTVAGDVQVAIVPFAKDVNAGSSNYNQSWIDWTIYGTCNISGIIDQPDCQSTHGTWTTGWNGSGSCNISGQNSKNACQNATGTWTSSTKKNWNGCVTDRGGPDAPSAHNYDVLNTTPTSSDTQSYFPAEQYGSCPEQLIALGYNWTNLSNEIDGMVANGSTNQTIGLVWGWQAMTQGLPLSPPTLPANTQQVIILLSDGLNTQDRWTGNGSNEDSGTDARMTLVCANAKAAGITIYTLFVDLNGTQGNSTVLQNCASDASKYFDLTTSGQIVDAFNEIGQQITNLRVSQ